MEVFLDETSLSASSGLKPGIWRALDSSRWFVLLASPEAAESGWVSDEITHWVSTKGADHLLVAVTEGTWIWDKKAVISALPLPLRTRRFALCSRTSPSTST